MHLVRFSRWLITAFVYAIECSALEFEAPSFLSNEGGPGESMAYQVNAQFNSNDRYPDTDLNLYRIERILFEQEEKRESVMPDDYDPKSTQDDKEVQRPDNTTALTVLLLSISFMILSCTALLYVCILQERYKHQLEELVQDQEQDDDSKDPKAGTIKKNHSIELKSRTQSNSNREPSLQLRRNQAPFFTSPITQDSTGGDIEEALFMVHEETHRSISPISSVTSSLPRTDGDKTEMDRQVSENGIIDYTNEGFSAYQAAYMFQRRRKNVELNFRHRLDSGTDLEAIVDMVQNEKATVHDEFPAVFTNEVKTNGNSRSLDHEVQSSNLVKRQALNVPASRDVAILPPSEVSIVQRHTVLKGRLLEESGVRDRRPPNEELTYCPTDESSSMRDTFNETESRLRELCFTPLRNVAAATSMSVPSFGVEVKDSDAREIYPCILGVDASSPLIGRIFVGDKILAFNDRDAAGFTAHDLQDMAASTSGVIKLRVRSTHCDSLSSDCSTSTISLTSLDSDDVKHGPVEI